MATPNQMAAVPQPHQPQTVPILLIQHQGDTNDYTIKNAKGGGAVLLLVALANFAVYLYLGVQYGEWQHSSFISSFCLFTVSGSLALAAANQSNSSLVMAVHTWCVITYVQATVQIGMSLWDLFTKGIFMLQYFMFTDTLVIDALFSALALVAIICAAYIQSLAGKVTCCRPASNNLPPQQGYTLPQGYTAPAYSQPATGVQGYTQPGYTQPTYTQPQSGYAQPQPGYMTKP